MRRLLWDSATSRSFPFHCLYCRTITDYIPLPSLLFLGTVLKFVDSKMPNRGIDISAPIERSRSTNHYKAPSVSVQTYELSNMDDKNEAFGQMRLPATPPAPLHSQAPPPPFQDASMVSIPADMFDRMFLKSQEQDASKNTHRQFANPTPISVVGYLLALSPLSCDLMGWRGAGGNGAASMYVSPSFAFTLLYTNFT